jgi:hypothetical protein
MWTKIGHTSWKSATWGFRKANQGEQQFSMQIPADWKPATI